jgi:hypothetical protein
LNTNSKIPNRFYPSKPPKNLSKNSPPLEAPSFPNSKKNLIELLLIIEEKRRKIATQRDYSARLT